MPSLWDRVLEAKSSGFGMFLPLGNLRVSTLVFSVFDEKVPFRNLETAGRDTRSMKQGLNPGVRGSLWQRASPELPGVWGPLVQLLR